MPPTSSEIDATPRSSEAMTRRELAEAWAKSFRLRIVKSLSSFGRMR
jgi:hypothetical protein